MNLLPGDAGGGLLILVNQVVIKSDSVVIVRPDSYRFARSGQTVIEGFLSFESLTNDRTYTFPNPLELLLTSNTVDNAHQWVNATNATMQTNATNATNADNVDFATNAGKLDNIDSSGLRSNATRHLFW